MGGPFSIFIVKYKNRIFEDVVKRECGLFDNIIV